MKTHKKKRKIKIGDWIRVVHLSDAYGFHKDKFRIIGISSNGHISVESASGYDSYVKLSRANIALSTKPTDREVIVPCAFTLDDLEAMLVSIDDTCQEGYVELSNKLTKLIKSHRIT